MWINKRVRMVAAICLFGGMGGFVTTATAKKFIPTFYVQYAPVAIGDELLLGKFDLLDLDRTMYDDLARGAYPTTWAAIRAVNPQAQIYLYQMGPEVSNYHDANMPFYLNGLGRYDVSRNHSMGSLNGNNPHLFLLDASGQRSYNIGYSTPANNQYWYLMDFGSPSYRSYWLEATNADVIAAPWAADGIFIDNAVALNWGGYALPTAYANNATWSSAMNAFVEDITAGLHQRGQKAWFNRGQTTTVDGFNAWLALDNAVNRPDVAMEEGAFAVAWGTGATQFYSEASWRRQVDTLNSVKNYKMTFLSHTDLDIDQVGTDNWGKPVTFWQTLWYALSSFSLGRNAQLDNAYFMFNGVAGPYNRIWWFEEYDKIDLGEPLGPYSVARVNTTNEVGGIREVNVYWREFTRGYVYVTAADPAAFTTDNWATWAYRSETAAINLPQAVKQLTHETLNAPITDLPTVSTINMPNHQGAILLKVADLTVDMAVTPSPVPLGGVIAYNVSVTNKGPSAASGVTLAGLAGCTLMPIIPSGGTATCSLSIPATTVGTVSKTVSASSVEVDPNSADNRVSAMTTVVGSCAGSGGYKVSGKIKRSNGSAVSGVTLNLIRSDNACGNRTTSAYDGSYQFTRLPKNTSYVITPRKSGCTSFAPASLTVTIGGRDVRNQNFTGGCP